MHVRLSAAALATAAAAVLAGPALARPAAVPYQVKVTITDASCVLDHPVAPQKLILFHVISNGSFSHQFKIWGVSSGIIKTGREGIFKVKFRAAGSYGYACYNSHGVLARGTFRIR
jgi:hypothetical protein